MMIQYDTTRNDCLLDLTMSYGRYAANKLSQAVNEREEALGRKLSRDEVLRAYREIDEQLCRTLMTRQGK
jgi:hypothetical protein